MTMHAEKILMAADYETVTVRSRRFCENVRFLTAGVDRLMPVQLVIWRNSQPKASVRIGRDFGSR
jgi:hypothetical protein